MDETSEPRADVPEEWRDLVVDLTPGHVVRPSSGPPTHAHEDGSRCMWVRHGGIDRWRAVDTTGWDLGPCPHDRHPEYGHPDVFASIGSLRAGDVGKWIVTKGLDRPKQIIAVIHNESTTAVHWYRHPEKRDAKSGMVAQHDHMVMLYRADPTRVLPPAETEEGGE